MNFSISGLGLEILTPELEATGSCWEC